MSGKRKLIIAYRHCIKIKIRWNEIEVGMQLRSILKIIHDKCDGHGKDADLINYSKGANIFGFTKTADAMLAYSVIWHFLKYT